MPTLSLNSTVFATDYYTTKYHTNTASLSQVDLAAAKLDRFYIEISGQATEANVTILSSGTADFTDSGDSDPSSNVTDANYSYMGGDVDPNHLEMYSGTGGWAAAGSSTTTITLGDGKVYNLVGSIETYGFRFDSREIPLVEGSPVVGYQVTVSDAAGRTRVLFFPMADQNLNALVLPNASGQMAPGATKSVITHADKIAEALDGSGYDYLAYADLYSGTPGPAPDYIVEGTSGGDLIDATYIGDPEGDQIDASDAANGSNDDVVTADGGNDTVHSGAGNDLVYGGTGDDLVYGGDGRDTLLGEVGNDQLFGGAENDSLDGGDGNDSLFGGADTDTLSGGAGADSLAGGDGNDILYGGAGADTLAGQEGVDSLYGGDNDDDILSGAGDSAFGGAGDDEFTFDPTLSGNALISVTGGETLEESVIDPTNNPGGRTGDVLDLRGLTAVSVVYNQTDPTWNGTTSESGTATYTNSSGQTVTINFAEIENVIVPDYIVEGTSGNDLIDASYTGDPEGDRVDNNDGNPIAPGAAGGNNDSIAAGAGDDTVYSGVGQDTILAEGGNDLVYGGDGDDSVYGGTGEDTVYGGLGTDRLYGDDGNDSLFGYEGSDQLFGGAGNDYINTRPAVGSGVPNIGYPGLYTSDTDPNDDRDAAYGGSGNDTILTGDDADQALGGIGDDSIDAGFDNDIVLGEDGNDTLLGNEGEDLVQGGNGADLIYGGLALGVSDPISLTDDIDLVPNNNRDSLFGGAGNDIIYGMDDADSLDGGADDDRLYGGIDNDTLGGGTGRDTLDGGHGVDSLTGGLDADLFIADGTADVITDFDVTTGIGNGQIDDNDYVDLTAFYNETTLAAWNAANPGNTFNNPLAWMRWDQSDGQLQSAGGFQINSGGAAVSGSALSAENTGVVCFAAGTLIKTMTGEVPVQDLKPGDKVLTVDNGYQPLRWIGSRLLRAEDLAANPALLPIRIRAGALGENMPLQDLTVSPQHRVVVRSTVAMKMFDSAEVLVAAKHLLGLKGISVCEDMSSVEYWHFLFDQHEIVFSNGAQTESLFTGPEALKSVSADARIEILTLFPELAEPEANTKVFPARPLVMGRRGRQMAQRLAWNDKLAFTRELPG